MATRVPALIQLSDPRVAAQLVILYDRNHNKLSEEGLDSLFCCLKMISPIVWTVLLKLFHMDHVIEVISIFSYNIYAL